MRPGGFGLRFSTRLRNRLLIAPFAVICAALLVVPSGAVGRADASSRCGADPIPAALASNGVMKFDLDADGGNWMVWFVAPDAVAPPSPPKTASVTTADELEELHEYQLLRTPSQQADAIAWSIGPATKPWEDIELSLIKQYSAMNGSYNPPRISRHLALLETAMYDALVATYAAKYCYNRPAPSMIDPAIQPLLPVPNEPSYPSEHAAAAGAAAVILAAIYPNEPTGKFDRLAEEAAESRLVAGLNYRSDVEAGLEIGRAVAMQVLAARAADGSDSAVAVTPPTDPCNWIPTPPAFKPTPVEPAWGRVKPFVLARGDQFRPAPPPACGSLDFTTQTRDLYETSKSLTTRQREIGLYWAGNPGSVTPPGMWLSLAMNESIAHDLTSLQHARVTAHVAVALADAAIACWDTKFTYWWERPVTTIRREIDPSWSPIIPTPPFPGYVSGHSTFGGAATTVLSYFFPDSAREFSSLATEAANSRFYAGIHIRADNEVGLALGESVGVAVIERAMADGGP